MSLKKEKMSTVDTAWWHMEDSTNLMMITSVMTFSEQMTYAELKQVVEQRMLRYDRFHQRVVDPTLPLTGASWELDPHFDIDAHLRHVALPDPGDRAMLEDFVGILMGTPLDYTKPLWQIHLVDNFGAGCAVITRLHHCIADGIALVRVLLTMTDETADASWIDVTEETIPRKSRRFRRVRRIVKPAVTITKTTGKAYLKLAQEGYNTYQNPGRVRDATKMGLSATATLGKIILRWPDPKSIYKGALGTQKRASWSKTIKLDEVKAIGHVLGGTVNDVMATAVAGSLRRYLEEHGQQTKGLNLRAYIPVNLRPLDGPIELGNRFGLVFLSLPIGIVDQVERFQEVKHRMDELKNSPEAQVAITLLGAGGIVTKEVQTALFDFFHTKATTVMTNVPGPNKPLYMAGKEMTSLMAWVPQSGKLGLGISIISYAGDMQVGINTDAGLVPDPDRIVEYIVLELEEMLELAKVLEVDY